MKAHLLTMSILSLLPAFSAMATNAHTIPWQAGESRVVGVGHCAKGPCLRRVYWGNSKPHRHVNGKVVFDRIVSVRVVGS